MKPYYLLIFTILFSAVLITGCSKGATNSSFKECGSDLNCYADSLKTCSPARYYVSEGDQYAQMRVISLDGNVCKTEWTSNEGEMICNIPKEDLSKVNSDDFTAGHMVTEVCNGSYVDKLFAQMRPLK